MDSQNRYPHKLKWIRVIFTICVIVLACIMVLMTQRVVNSGMRQHQLQMLDMVTGRITENMNSYFRQQWNNIQYVRNTMGQRSFADEEELLSALGEGTETLRESHRDLYLFLIDDEGFYYSADAGKVAYWRSPNTAFASTELDREKSVSISSLDELNTESREYLCFTKKLETALTAADGSHFTHMVLATDKSIFDIDLSLASFGTITDAFVMNSKGKTVNAQQLNTELAKTYNLVKTLEKADFFLGNTYEELKTALTDHTNVVSMIGFDQHNYYISFQSMGIEDWYAVFLVDQHDMNSSVSQTMYQMSLWLTLGFVMMGIAIIAYLLYTGRLHLTEERRTKEQLRLSMEAAKQANLAKSEFLSRMSHDIRTPLNGIIGMTDMAEVKAKSDDGTALMECLRKIRSASRHLQTLVNEVLDISRIESGMVVVNAEQLNLQTSLSVVNDIIESRALSRNQSYEMDLSGIIHPYVMADSNLLNQILLNLLGNSVKYTPEGGHIRFTVFEEAIDQKSAAYHFIIADDGIGMKPEFLERIYERFSQESISARSSYEGTGLGMAIVKEFVDLLGGTIAIESEVQVGTTFEVVLTFPVLEQTETSVTEEPDEQESAHAYHILLAEDNNINREIAIFILTENGMSCEVAENGQQLVDMFSRSAPDEFDAIVTDIRMPVMDGLEAARMIRGLEREDAGTIPIIALTANAYDNDRALSQQVGIDAHLTKPLQAELILKTLKQLCRKRDKKNNET